MTVKLTRRRAGGLLARIGGGAAVARALGPATGPWILSSCSRGRERPNILFIFSDDHAGQAIGAYGSRINRTPNIDRLAAEGVIFRNSFCTNGICAPSRAVVLTGKHSHRNGKIDNSGPFDMSQPTFNKMLQASGYQTALIGKWHLQADPEGFDHWTVLPGQGHYYNPDFLSPTGRRRHEGYVTGIITDRALDWLEGGREKERPFLLMCQHKAPHRNWMPAPDKLDLYEGESIPEPETLFDDGQGRAGPFRRQEMTIARHLQPAYDLKITPPERADDEDARNWRSSSERLSPAQRERWEAAYAPRNEAFRRVRPEGRERVRYFYQRYIKDYLRCVSSVDDGVGRLLDGLDDLGLAENTLVVYSSDQGFFLGEHGFFDKRWMYEESLRMPLLMRWPDRIRPGSVVEGMVQNIDYAPTFLEAAGLVPPADLQGQSLLPLLAGGSPPEWRESIYYHYYEYPAVHMVARHYGVRTNRWKLIHYYETGEWELFDLQEDPRELHSRHADADHAGIRQELEGELRRLRAYYGDDTGRPF